MCNITGFSGFHNYGESKIGGGISIFVKDSLMSESLGLCHNSNILECLAVKVYCNNIQKWVNVMGVYRPPSTPVKIFNENFNQILESSKVTQTDCIIAGDFNICLMNEMSLADSSEFQDMMQSNHLLPIITCPTRVTDKGASLIDHVWTNILSETQSGVIEINVTDHYPTLSIFKYYKNNLNDKIKIEFRDVNDCNVCKFKSILNETDWSYILGESNNPNNYVSNF